MAVKRFYRRRFLNLRGHHAGAYVLADCGIAEWDDGRTDSSLTIADCNRVVVLDFSVPIGDDAEVRNALYKARTLRAVVDDLVAALEALHEKAGPARKS